jgi:hypothetical protein
LGLSDNPLEPDPLQNTLLKYNPLFTESQKFSEYPKHLERLKGICDQ